MPTSCQAHQPVADLGGKLKGVHTAALCGLVFGHEAVRHVLDWSGKTLSEHRADRAAVVREAMLSAGMVAPELERLAASVLASDGLPSSSGQIHPAGCWLWQTLLKSITERQRWRG